MSNAATSDHRYHPPLLQNYVGAVKASQTTPDDQDLLQDQQHCSRPTTTSPGNFILIPATPDHHHHHPDPPWTTQSLPNPSWLTSFTTGLPTLLQVHSNQSWLYPMPIAAFPDYHYRHPSLQNQWRRYTRSCQVKWPGEKANDLVVDLAVEHFGKIIIKKIKFQYIWAK